MKKLITIALTLFFSGSMMLFAQLPTPRLKNTPRPTVRGERPIIRTNTTRTKRAVGPSWFNVSETVRLFNGGPTSAYSFTTVFPDTNALFAYSDGQGGEVVLETNVNSVGLVFDPRSAIYDNNPFMITKFSNYTVDSLRFAFFYRRFNSDPNLVDTIVVTTFDKASINRGFTTIYAGAVDYTTDRYRAAGTGTTVYTILLTKDDTSSNIQERVLAINKTIQGAATGGNYFGATISYLSGYKGYKHGLPFDTVVNFNSGVVDATRVNTFRLQGYYDPNMYVENATVPATIDGNRIYNHGIVAEQRQRYKIAPVVDYYYPAFYGNSHLFPVIDFLVSSADNNVSPAIVVKGNSVTIADGDNTPAKVDNTHFGNVLINTPATTTFVIENTQGTTLTINSVNFTGTNGAEFSLVSAPTFPLTISGNSSVTLTVRFLPLSLGVRNCVMNINSDDPLIATYNFALQGITMLTSINTFSSATISNIYPNPVKVGSGVVVEMNSEVAVKSVVTITDVTGKVVKTINYNLVSGNNEIKLSVEGLTSGIYVVAVKAEGVNTVAKLTIE